MFQFDEKIYQGEYAVKYVLETVPNCKKMLVVFSSFNRITAPIQHTYNYIRTLSGLKCNKLFILDGFGPRGCYYMVDGMNSAVEDSVIALIDEISTELGLSRKDLISVGSSKGGSAALYYGMKYHFGSILSGAPQIRIADYVTRAATETADFMLGTPWTQENVDRLNRKIMDLIDHVNETEINIISSKNDWQYQAHVVPFLNELDRKRVPYNLTMSDAVKDHNDIANHFPNYLIRNVLRIVYGIDFAGSCTADLIDNALEIENTVNTGGFVSCLYKLMSEKEQITYKTMSKNLCVNLHTPGIYVLTMNILFNNDVVYEQQIGKFIFGGDYFKLKDIHHTIEDNKLRFAIAVDAFTKDIAYSFYLIKDGAAEKKVFHQKSPEIVFDVSQFGKYRVQWYIHLNKNTIKISDSYAINR